MRALLIFGLIFGLILGIAEPADAAPGKGFPIPSLARWRGLLTSPVWTGVPRQPGGAPYAGPGVVPAAKTRSKHAVGRKPGTGKGALPTSRPYVPKAAAGKSGRLGGKFDARTSKMDSGKSSATVSLYRNTDGSITRKLSQFPVNYRTPGGRWEPIDTSLAKNHNGRYTEKANSLTVSLAPTAADPNLVTVKAGSDDVGFSLVGAADSAPVVDGSSATYPQVLPGTSLVETAGATGAKESIVLAAAPPTNSWTFALHTGALSAAVDKAGGVTLTDPKGATAGRIPPAFAHDAKVNPGTGTPATTWAVTYGLTGTNGDYQLTVTVDAGWLADPARVYPVTVDPSLTFNTSGTVSTTYTTSTGPGDFSGDTGVKSGECLAANCGGTDTKAIGLLKFPTFPDNQGYSVTAASVHLFNTFTATTVGAAACTSTNTSVTWSTINLAPITQGWTVAGAKAYPGPAKGASIGSAAPATWNACKNTAGTVTTGDWVSIPITDLTYLNNWSFNQQPDYGLAVYGATGALTWRTFDSDVESAQSPYLQITYSDQAPQVNSQYPANGYNTATLTPELLASASKPANSQSSTALAYDFTVYDKTGATVVDSGKLSTGDYTVPNGYLDWSQTYYWTVAAWDGTLWSVPKPPLALTTAVPQPVITSSLSQNGDHGFDASSGNFTTEETDAEVASAGPQLQVVRDYNSRDPRTTGAFGAAWSSVFDAKASEQYNASGAVVSVTVNYPDGSQVGFGRNVDGSFAPPSGRFAMLRAVTGGYTLTDKNDTVYTFKQALPGVAGGYGISSVADADLRTVSFTWTSDHITTMTSGVSGRALHLTWSAPAAPLKPHVTRVSTDPVTGTDQNTDLSWVYWYTGDQLAEVCDPNHAGCTNIAADVATRYSYAPSGSQYNSAVLDAGPQSFWPLSDPAGSPQAASAAIANEGGDNAALSNVTLGAAGPITGSTATAATFNGTSSTMMLPAGLVGAASYQTVGLWFKTTTAGVLLSYQQDTVVPGTTTTHNYVPALYVGTSGKLYGELWNGSVDPIISSGSVADGNWHYAVLSAGGTTQSLYLDGNPVGTPVAGTVAPYAVGGTNNEYVGAGYWGGAWPDEPHVGAANAPAYPSYFAGSIADVQFFAKPLMAPAVKSLSDAGLNPAALLTKIVTPGGKTQATVAYDSATARVTSTVDENGGTWTLNPPTVTGSSDSYRAAVLGSAPSGYYRLGDSAGSASAYSETNHGPGLYNNVTLGVQGPFDDRSAAQFDGTSSYLALPATDHITTGPNSVELWFTMPAGNVNGGVLFDGMSSALTSSTPETGGWDPVLYVGTDGRLHGEIWTGTASSTLASAGLVNDGKWHHAVLSASTSSQTLYLDGNAAGTLNATIVDAGLTNTYVGAGETNGGWPFHPTNTLGYFPGSIAEFAFYRGQLSAAEVAAHYAAYGAGRSSGAPTQTTTVIDPGGHTLTYKYDPLHSNRLISQTDGTGATTSYGYDTGGFLHTVTDPNGNVTTTDHDIRGNTTAETTCQNQAAQTCSTDYYTYYPDDTTAVPVADPRNDLVMTARDGRSASATDNTYLTSYAYNVAGDRTSTMTPPVAGFPSGRTSKVTYSDGTPTYPAADSGNTPAGLPVTTVSPGGASERTAYFHNGDVASTTDADGLVTLYAYDGVGRPISKTENPGSAVGWWRLNQTGGTTVADASGTGNVATPANMTWSGGAGVFNGTTSQIVTAAPVLNTGTSYTMSAWASLSSLPTTDRVVLTQKGTNADAAELTYAAGGTGWKFQTTGADVSGPSTSAVSVGAAATAATWYHLVGVYDATSRTMRFYVNNTLIGTTTAAAAWTGAKNLSIGSAGGASYFPGSITNVQVYQRALSAAEIGTLFTAGRAGSTVASTTPNGQVTTTGYDGLNQVVSKTDPTVTNRVSGAAHTATTTTVYDPDGNKTSQTVADSVAGGDTARTTSSTFNQYNQQASSTDADGNTTSKTYDAYGNVQTQTSPTGDVTTYTYDADNRVKTAALSNYTGDPANPVAAHSQTMLTKVYDPAGRVYAQVDAMSNGETFTYTDNGLQASQSRAHFDSAGTVTSSFTEESDGYDAAGNLTSKVTGNGANTTTATVDAADRQTKVIRDPAGVARSTTLSYTPDDAVATSAESDYTGAERTQSFTYDAEDKPVSQSVNLDGSGHPVAWWRLNQTSGSTVTDNSGTGNTAAATGTTWSGSSTATFTGAAGQQIATNGPTLTTTASYSVSAWVSLSAVPTATEGVVSQDGAVNSAFSLQYNASDGAWAFSQTATDTSGAATTRAHGSTKPAANTWYHLVGTYDSGTGAMNLYVNDGAPAAATKTGPFQANGVTVIGRDKAAGVASDLLSGSVANVQVYNRVLSPADVAVLYQAGRTGGTVASSNLDTTTFTRDVRGLPITQTDPNGNTTNYTYDETGQLAVTVQPAVSAETYGNAAAWVRPVASVGYDTFGEPTQSQDPDGNTTTTVYDADGNKVSQTLPAYTPPGTSTPITPTQVWAYDRQGRLASQQDALSHATSYTYDQFGDQATATTADGGVTHSTYDLAGEQLSVTDASGAQQQATYDYVGRQVTATTLERYPSAQTLTTTNSYTASSSNPGGANLASVTSPGGAVTQYGYNGDGQKVSTTDPAGNTTTYTYTYADDPFTQTNPDGTSVAWQYDANRKLTDTRTYSTTALLTQRQNDYDAAGNLLDTRDANGNYTTYTYDATGSLAQEVQPVTATTSITTSFGYDPAGNRTRYTDGRGTNWYTTYNPWNTKQTDVEPGTTAYSTPASCTTTYAYDADGRLTSQALPGGVTQSFGYDVMGNLTTQQGAGASATTADRSFTYDKLGRMLTAATSNTSGSGIANATSESFSYDDRSDLLTAAGSAGSTTLAYNGDSLLTSRADASGTSSYSYDPADRLKTVTDALTGTTETYTSYNKQNQVTAINMGAGDVRKFGYDDLHRLTSDQIQTPGGATVSSIGYGYDNNSNLTSKNTTGFGTAVSNTYTYDQADRLTSWNNGSTTTGYGYDAAGNRTQVGAKTFTYDARDQLTSDGTTGYTYTAAGVMSFQGSTALTSDAYGQQTTDGTVSYTYDALGRMTQRGLGAGSQAMQYSGVGNQVAADSQYLYSRDPLGNPLGVRTTTGATSTARLVVTDQHTDVVATMSATDTTLTQTAFYDPLGNTIGTRTAIGNLGYQSEYTDTTSGRVNMSARWYNPGTGQFTSRDTVQNSPSPNSAAANPFAYAADQPLNGTDPTGHMFAMDGGSGYGGSRADQKIKVVNRPSGINGYNSYLKPSDVDVRHRRLITQHHGKVPVHRLADGRIDGPISTFSTVAPKKTSVCRGSRCGAFKHHACGDEATCSTIEWAYFNELQKFADKWGGGTYGWSVVYSSRELPNMAWVLLAERFKKSDPELAKHLPSAQHLINKLVGDDIKDDPELLLPRYPIGLESLAGDIGEDTGAGRAYDCSFAAQTGVLMANGAVRPIAKIAIGDEVASTDPAKGKVVGKQVVALHDNVDTDMADLTVADARGHQSVLHTTQNHPFWDTITSQWTRADHLHAGDHLKSIGKAVVRVVTVHAFTRAAHRYNLTVADLHTYYVMAGTAPVLVHNTPQPDPFGVPREPGVYIIHLKDVSQPYVGQGKNMSARWREHFYPAGKLNKLGYSRDDVASVEYRLPAAGQSLDNLENQVIEEYGGIENLPFNARNAPMHKLYKNGEMC